MRGRVSMIVKAVSSGSAAWATMAPCILRQARLAVTDLRRTRAGTRSEGARGGSVGRPDGADIVLLAEHERGAQRRLPGPVAARAGRLLDPQTISSVIQRLRRKAEARASMCSCARSGSIEQREQGTLAVMAGAPRRPSRRRCPLRTFGSHHMSAVGGGRDISSSKQPHIATTPSRRWKRCAGIKRASIPRACATLIGTSSATAAYLRS